MSLSKTSYDASVIGLLPADAVGYRAAGILVCRNGVTDGKWKVLLAIEHRPGEIGGAKLNIPGGMAESGDMRSSKRTAGREFCEETGGLVSSHVVQQMLNGAKRIWVGSGKYVLHTCKTTEMRYLPEQFIALGNHRPPGVEAEAFTWVALDDLLMAVRNNSTPSLTVKVGSRMLTVAFSVFLVKLLTDAVVVKALRDTIRGM